MKQEEYDKKAGLIFSLPTTGKNFFSSKERKWEKVFWLIHPFVEILEILLKFPFFSISNSSIPIPSILEWVGKWTWAGSERKDGKIRVSRNEPSTVKPEAMRRLRLRSSFNLPCLGRVRRGKKQRGGFRRMTENPKCRKIGYEWAERMKEEKECLLSSEQYNS